MPQAFLHQKPYKFHIISAAIKVFYFNKTLIYDLTIKRNQGSESQNKGQSGKHSGMTIARTSKKEVLLMKLLKKISHLMEEYYKIFSK